MKSRYSVWPSAYASGALVKCRKVGAANWGNSRKEEVEYEIAESMPSNPSYKGVGATKKSNPFPQGKQKVRVFKEPQRMFVKGDGKVLGSDLTPKEYSKKNFPSAETTKKELKKTYDKEVPYYDSRGSDTLSQNRGKEGTFRKIDSDLKTFHNKRVVATAGKGSKDKDKYSSLDYSKGSKLANIRKKDVNRPSIKDHYSWRDSFELTENQANRMKLSQQRQKQNAGRAQQQMGAIKSAVGGAAKAVGGAVGGAVKAVGSALKTKPMVRKPGQTSVRTRGGGAPQVAKPKPQPKPAPQATPAPQAKPAAPMAQAKPTAPAPKMGRTEVANRQKLGNERVDALKAKNAQFQAAKKSGNLAQFRKDNPKLSGRERAQQMAKARIAAKNAPAAKPTANTVSKPAPQQAQARQSAPAPQAKPTPQVKTQGGQGDKPLGSTTVRGGTTTRTGADAASAAAKVGGTQNIPASQKVTPTSSTSGPGKGSIKFEKGALSKLVSGDKPTANTVSKPESSVPTGSFGISAKGKEQAAANRKEVAVKNNQSGGGVKKPVSPEMQRRLNRMNVGKNAAAEVNRVNPKPGQTVNVKQDPKTGSVSSTVTSNKTIGVDTSPGKSDTKSLVNPNKKQNVKNAKNLKKDFMKVDKETSSMSIDKEPKAQVTVGKFDDF